MLKFLVVDDALTERTRVSGLLKKAFDCEVTTAGDGHEALQLLDDSRADLVLTDLQMPRMDGLALLVEIRQEYPMIPVVLMTAQGSEEIAAEAMRSGAVSYVPKRLLGQDLVRTVSIVLSSASKDRAQSSIMHQLEEGRLAFRIRNDPAMISAVVALIQQMLRCLPLGDETERMRVCLAVEAALSNALIHGNLASSTVEAGLSMQQRSAEFQQRSRSSPYSDRRIHVTIEISKQQARFVIRDEGDGFDTTRIDSDALSLDAESLSGRGIALMHAIMDSVTFNEAGNQVTMIRQQNEG